VGAWVRGCVGAWVRGWVWVCGCVGVWVCVCVGVWVCGCVGVWVCGCVCVCTIIYIHITNYDTRWHIVSNNQHVHLLAEAMVGGRAAGSVSTPAEPYRSKSAGNRSIDGLAKWFLGFS